LNASLAIGGLLTVLGRAGNDVVAFGQASGAMLVDTSVSPKLDGGGGTDSLLVVKLYINDMLVDNVNDFSPLPVGFENTLV
jgi:hypothetical protein